MLGLVHAKLELLSVDWLGEGHAVGTLMVTPCHVCLLTRFWQGAVQPKRSRSLSVACYIFP